MSGITELHDRHRALIGVLYAEDFDDDATAGLPAPTPEPEPEPEVIEPSYSVAEMDAARAEGRASGLADAERGLAASRLNLLSQIVAAMDGADVAGRIVAEQAADALANTILAALTACLPALCDRYGETELRALARALLPNLRDEPRVTIRVHPLMLPAMNAEVAALDVEIAERVTLIASEQIPPGDARMNWQDGSAVRDAGRARAAVEDALAVLGLLEKEMIDA